MRLGVENAANARISRYMRALWASSSPTRQTITGTTATTISFDPAIDAPVIVNDTNSDARVRIESTGTVSSNAWPLDPGDLIFLPVLSIDQLSVQSDNTGTSILYIWGVR